MFALTPQVLQAFAFEFDLVMQTIQLLSKRMWVIGKCNVCIGIMSFDNGAESSIWVGVRIRVVPVMGG